MTTAIETLQDLNTGSLRNSFLKELEKVITPEKAHSLGRVFFTYQAIWDADKDHKYKFVDCSTASIMHALISCAETDLYPSAAHKYVYVYPMGNNKVKFEISYMGLIRLLTRHPDVVSVNAQVFREGEKFILKSPSEFEHLPDFETINNPIKGSYAWVEFKNHPTMICMLGSDDLKAIRACAKSDRAWGKWYGEMCKKAAIRRLYKMVLPQLDEAHDKTLEPLKQALKIDDEEYTHAPIEAESEPMAFDGDELEAELTEETTA